MIYIISIYLSKKLLYVYMYISQNISVKNFNICSGPSPDTGDMGVFLGKNF